MAKWTEQEDRYLIELCKQPMTWDDRATEINRKCHRRAKVRSKGAAKHRVLDHLQCQVVHKNENAARFKGTTPAPKTPDLQVRQTESNLDVVMYADGIRSLEDLIAYAQVDVTKWEASSFECNKWDMGYVDPEGIASTKALYQAKAKFRPVAAVVSQLISLRGQLLDDLREEGAFATPATFGTIFEFNDDIMLELGLPDLHLGKYAWDEETGNNYNVDMASDLFKEAFEALLARASSFAPGKVLLPIGNDFFHTDNRQNTTTAGTPQDADTRYFRMIRRGRQLYSWAIKRCIDEVGPVQCVIVPGNHDAISTTFLGEVLSAQFEANPHVSLDTSLHPRKYVRHGNVLLGFCHGNEEKVADLPLLMANEQAAAWAKTTHREWHVGHLHKAKETRFTAGDSFGGVRVRILPSLSATDYWHALKGYTGELRAAEAYLWSAGGGYLGHLNFSTKEQRAVECITL